MSAKAVSLRGGSRAARTEPAPAVRTLVAAYRGLIRVVEALLGGLTVFLAVIVPVGVFFRYAMNSALSWTDEVGGLTLVWITFYGSVVALDRGLHLDFDLVVKKMPRRWERIARAVVDLALAVLLVVVLVNGWTITNRLMGQTIVSMPIPRGIFYSVMPISALLMLLVLAARWFLPDATTWDRKRHHEVSASEVVPSAESSTE